MMSNPNPNKTSKKNSMKIATIVTSTHYVPSYNMHEERQTRIVRPYRVTYRGAERILRREAREDGREWTGTIVRLEFWTVASR